MASPEITSPETPVPGIALAHDYLTQRGGAERVAAVMARTFPGAPLHTTLYDPTGTFPDFESVDVRTRSLNRSRYLRRHHRAALPFLAHEASRTVIEADVVLASSSGWAHGFSTTGRKVVYCHAPARWLYQEDRYLGRDHTMLARHRLKSEASGLALRTVGGYLRAWDAAASRTADRYVVNSTVVRHAVLSAYGIEAEVLPPPPALLPAGDEAAVPGVDRPFLLCVARLLPYKNVDAVIEAALDQGAVDLVVVGDGPDRARLAQVARGSRRIHLLGKVGDAELRWLYRHCSALVAASFEDYGLSPLEAAAFGKPTIALRAGGYLDTIREGRTGLYFDESTPPRIARAIDEALARPWCAATLGEHAESFSEGRFAARLRKIVAEELQLARSPLARSEAPVR